MLLSISTEYQTIKQVLMDLRTELRKLAIGERLDRIAIESIRGFILFNITTSYYNNEEKEYLNQLDQEQCGALIEKRSRLKSLSRSYFNYFEHYWKCYDEGNTLAKYDMISYGESYVIAMLEVLRLEEKLFNLTTKESIVQ